MRTQLASATRNRSVDATAAPSVLALQPYPQSSSIALSLAASSAASQGTATCLSLYPELCARLSFPLSNPLPLLPQHSFHPSTPSATIWFLCSLSTHFIPLLPQHPFHPSAPSALFPYLCSRSLLLPLITAHLERVAVPHLPGQAGFFDELRLTCVRRQLSAASRCRCRRSAPSPGTGSQSIGTCGH